MISPVSASLPSVSDTNAESIATAAGDFEALLIAQLLRAARESDGTSESDSIMEMAENQLASLMARNGGLGLAGLVTKGLNAAPPPPTLPKE
jgi:Rod binding domain-containing protein